MTLVGPYVRSAGCLNCFHGHTFARVACGIVFVWLSSSTSMTFVSRARVGSRGFTIASEEAFQGHGNLPPVFTQDMNNLALSEQTPVGTVVYKLEGYDPEGGNVSFGLIGSDNFIADPISGEVQVIQGLDREFLREATLHTAGWANIMSIFGELLTKACCDINAT
uniref:Cadherin domain-containing protein n=1 Tax=Anopheles farauti TaxID=69004 RepID=A0A182Q4N0_9DIPT